MKEKENGKQRRGRDEEIGDGDGMEIGEGEAEKGRN